MRQSKNVVLFQCHRIGQSATAEFDKISAGIRGADVLLLFHEQPGNSLTNWAHRHVYSFTYESLAKGLPYALPLKNRIVPGSAHFPLLQFFSDFPEYDHYWLIEGDVRFTGDWMRFFDDFVDSDADFLSSHLRQYVMAPRWVWWNHMAHPTKQIPVAHRLASFNPIYRISRRALAYLDDVHRHEWRGHFEVLIATMLYHRGFKLRDFGGKGTFVATGDENRYYTSRTLRFRPSFQKVGRVPDKLYHPVKCL